MNKILNLSTALMLVIFAGMFSACKKSFDNPPGPADPAIVANISIKDHKALHTGSGAYTMITSDYVISGVVVADDKAETCTNNYISGMKRAPSDIARRDESLHVPTPVGRDIHQMQQVMSERLPNNLMALGVKATVGGLPSQEGIPGNLISNYVIGGSLNNPVVPKLVTFADLTIPSSTSQKPWFRSHTSGC